MKQCPKCKASVSDNAKFCIKCGFNIKKHEEENSTHFCPECGTKVVGGKFCPECGYNLDADLEPQTKVEPKPKKVVKKSPKIDLDDFGLDLDETSKMLDEKISNINVEDEYKSFEYKAYGKDKYIITKYTDLYETDVIIPKNTIGINEKAFEGTYITSVKLNQGLKTIGKRAFANCKHLVSINIPSSVNRIDDEAFLGCDKLKLALPNTVVIKGENIFGANSNNQQNQIKITTVRGDVLNKLGFYDTFIGEVDSKNLYNGFGTYTWEEDGKCYTHFGHYSNGIVDGLGVFLFPDGTVQAGKYVNGLLNGYGVETQLEDDTLYIGEYEEGYSNVEIDFYFDVGNKPISVVDLNFNAAQENNGIYIGFFKNGKKHGFGRYSFNNGAVYVGQYINGEATGIGVCGFVDGGYYIGQFKNMRYDGYGIFIFANGKIQFGKWKENKFIGD